MKNRTVLLLVSLVFLLGFEVGTSLSPSPVIAAPQPPATIVGENGYLTGWDVTITTDDGDEVKCSDPFVWKSLKEIECDAE